MSLTVAEVKKFMQSCFPQGTEQYLDWDNPAANVSQFFTANAGVWKRYAADVLDTLRLEISPLTCTENIPVWESALGLSTTPLAMFGTTTQRRNQILSWLRQSGSFSLADIRSIVQPFFNYDDPNDIEILEPDRVVLTTLHTYADFTGFTIGANGTASSTVFVPDDPLTSPAGARIQFTLAAGAIINELRIVLDGPDGTRAGWRGDLYLGTGVLAAPTTYTLESLNFRFKPIRAHWTFTLVAGPSGGATLNSWALTPVEGQGVNYDRFRNRIGEGLGAAMFEWAVVADEDLLGTGYDLTGALRALRRMKPAHTQLAIVWRPAGATDNCAIPDLRSATPDAAIPCS